jgi:rubrerythrin
VWAELVSGVEAEDLQPRIEDFVCEKCGARVKGNGYTDHCPVCLWGKHVDVNPGDRKAKCGGMMEPVHVFKKKNDYIIEYICEMCGHKFSVKSAPEDKFGVLISIIKNSVIGN